MAVTFSVVIVVGGGPAAPGGAAGGGTAVGYANLLVSTTADNAAVLRMLTARGIEYAVDGNAVTAWVNCA
ncbi:hypothetical protein [Nocardia abscessus]|uniref:hypothetical protein n=1 Tax=Nocardia abscessus TaxID=120957 RepID=UPI00245877BC|nr:hypothetical protein [Nocardia abscessus]